MAEYSAEVVAEARRLLSEGVTAAEAGRRLGIPATTIKYWREKAGMGEVAAKAALESRPVVADAAKDMEIAALRQMLKIAEGTQRPQEASGPVVVSGYVPPPESSPAARWVAAEGDNAERIKRARTMAQFSVSLPAEPCAITFISDQHISIGNTVDLKAMRADAELVAETEGCYAVLGGDGCDNHIKHRAAVLAARSQPQEQYELFEWYLSIFAHRVLVAISGNHDLWTDQISGLDVMGSLCKRQRVCYAPDEAFLKLVVGEQPYSVGIRHQYRMNSSINETHAVKAWFRYGEHNWDIGCVGHNHLGCIEPFTAHGIERWACRPGSYQITSAYSRQFGYNSTTPTCPTFVLSPSERRIVGFHRLQDGIEFLKAKRA